MRINAIREQLEADVLSVWNVERVFSGIPLEVPKEKTYAVVRFSRPQLGTDNSPTHDEWFYEFQLIYHAPYPARSAITIEHEKARLFELIYNKLTENPSYFEGTDSPYVQSAEFEEDIESEQPTFSMSVVFSLRDWVQRGG